MMPGPDDIRRRVLLRALGSPLVVSAFLVGSTALAATWALDWGVGPGLFVGLAGLLTAAGAFVTQLALRGDKLAQSVSEELSRKEDRDHQRQLDALDRRLTQTDNDPRPEAALRDLRALVKAFSQAESTAGLEHFSTMLEIRSRVDELFGHCVKSLEKTGHLWETARMLHTADARKTLLNQREQLLADVYSVIRQLSQTLVAVQGLDSNQGSSTELTRLREELDQSLTVARTVDDRMRSMFGEPPVIQNPSSLSSRQPESKG